MNFKIIYLSCLTLVSLSLASCKKLIEVDPPYTSSNALNVFENNATAISAVTAMFTKLSFSPDLSTSPFTSISLYCGLSADEISVNIPGTKAYNFYYRNDLTGINVLKPDYWSNFYNLIFIANSNIEGLVTSNKLPAAVKNQMMGESKFIRAFSYYYLTSLYGDVPLVLTSDYKINALASRQNYDQVYDQIVADLKDAQSLLSENYLDGSLTATTDERIRPTKWAASALLSKVYLSSGDWQNAEIQSSSIINHTQLFALTDLQNAFLKNSREAIWQLQPTFLGRNTPEAWRFIIPQNGNLAEYNFRLNESLLNAFEDGDQRRTNWIDSVIISGITYYYPYKYKSATLNAAATEYSTMFRLAEQFLIRAEARAKQSNFAGSTEDINAIRARAGLNAVSEVTADNYAETILHERQIELFTEWGTRWFDLKRTNTVEAVMSLEAIKKGGNWESKDQLYPVTNEELLANPNLSQTPGY